MHTTSAKRWHMAKKKKTTAKVRVNLVAEPDWVKRAEVSAKKLGLSLSAYIRYAVSLVMDEPENRKK